MYRQYHRMDAFPPSELHPVDSAWLDGYTDLAAGENGSSGMFHWDRDIVEWLVDLGPKRSRRIDIWDMDWDEVAAQIGREVPRERSLHPDRDGSCARCVASAHSAARTNVRCESSSAHSSRSLRDRVGLVQTAGPRSRRAKPS